MRRRRYAGWCLALTLLVGGCGGDGDDNGDDAAPSARDEATTTTARGSSTESASRCPLTATQVGSVLGVEMTLDAGSCSFFPTGDAVVPNASYNNQFDVALSQEGRAAEGYEDEVDGVGDEAYSRYIADGTWLLVRAGDRVFEIRVDSAKPDADLASAKALALLVIGD